MKEISHHKQETYTEKRNTYFKSKVKSTVDKIRKIFETHITKDLI